MLSSFHLAFFAVYHIGQTTHDISQDWMWLIILPLPVLIGTLMAYRRVLPLFSLLSAVVIVKASDVALVSERFPGLGNREVCGLLVGSAIGHEPSGLMRLLHALYPFHTPDELNLSEFIHI